MRARLSLLFAMAAALGCLRVACLMRPSPPSDATRGLPDALRGGALPSEHTDARRPEGTLPAAPGDTAQAAFDPLWPDTLREFGDEGLWLGPAALDETSGHYVASLGPHVARLTLDPAVQERVGDALARGKPFLGATVVLEAQSGRVLALAETTQRAPERAGIALRAEAPAASVFKLVSAAALLEAGVSPAQTVCVSGGLRRLAPRHLQDRPGDACVPFADVVPLSLNAAMAKLSDRYLPPGRLHEVAWRLGFGRSLPFEVPVEASSARIPDDAFGRANAAAGFGDVRLSAFHAALLTSIIANRGELVPPRLIEDVLDGPTPLPAPTRRVLDASVAEALARMMRETTTRGTARKLFGRLRRDSPLAGVSVGAKTGSLLFYDEHVDHSWLVAFAPVDHPRVVVATVIVNDWQVWFTKAGPLAREALEVALAALGD